MLTDLSRGTVPQSVPVDPVLPHLAAALDPECMRREFDRVLSCCVADDAEAPHNGGRLSVNACSIRHVKYRPGRSCLVWYELDVSCTESAGRARQWYAARMYAPQSSLAPYRKALDGSLVMPVAGPAVLHLEAVDMVVWSFPNERKLDGLHALADPATLWSPVLPEVAREGAGDVWRIISAQHSVVSYAPERSCSVRVDLNLQHRTTRLLRPWRVYGKTYHDTQGADTFELMRELYAAGRTRHGIMAVPRPLTYQPDTRTLWQESVPGVTLHDALSEAPKARGIAPAARAVAALHGLDVRPARRLGVDSVVKDLVVVPELLEQLGMTSAAAANALAKQLTGDANTMRSVESVLLHGDLHAKNLLVPEGAPLSSESGPVAIIDLDTLALGPAAYDLGSWIAALLHRSLVEDRDRAATLAWAREFTGAYGSYAPTAVTDKDVRWYGAAALLNEHAFRMLTRLQSGCGGHLASVISLASDLISGRMGPLIRPGVVR